MNALQHPSYMIYWSTWVKLKGIITKIKSNKIHKLLVVIQWKNLCDHELLERKSCGRINISSFRSPSAKEMSKLTIWLKTVCSLTNSWTSGALQPANNSLNTYICYTITSNMGPAHNPKQMFSCFCCRAIHATVRCTVLEDVVAITDHKQHHQSNCQLRHHFKTLK